MSNAIDKIEKEEIKNVRVSSSTHERLLKRQFKIQNELGEKTSMDEMIVGMLNALDGDPIK